MHIALNGDRREIAAGLTLAALLGELRLEPSRVAVERNGEIVERANFSGLVLEEADRLEIIRLVGGG